MTRLLVLNVRSGGFIRPALWLFERQKPDILMLQEVLSSPDGETYYFDFLQKVQTATQLPHTFFSPTMCHGFGKTETYDTFEGNAILSRYPFDAPPYEEFTHGQRVLDWDSARDKDDMKLFQHVVINGVHHVHYHGFNEKTKQGNALTDRHCRRIADYMAELDGPKILAGDFNLGPESPSLKPLNDAYCNLCIKHGVETTRNLFARDKTMVDYIWVDDSIEVESFNVLDSVDDYASDHLALVLDFKVTGKKSSFALSG